MERLLIRRSAVLVALLGGLLVLFAATRTWVTAAGLGDTSAVQTVDIPGTDLAETTTAVALVGLAAAVALTIARRIVRWMIGLLLCAAASLVLFTAVSVVISPAEAALGPLGEITGTTEHAQHYQVGGAVWVAVVGAVLLLMAGLIVLLASSRWRDAAASKKYDRTSSAAAERPGGPPDASEPDELERDEPEPDEPEPDEFDLWDGLSRGADPTDRR